MTNPTKIIEVTACSNCPFEGKCSAWKPLTRMQRVTLMTSNSVPHDMMLEKCPLPTKGKDHD